MVIDKVKLLKNIIIDIISNGKKKDWKAYSLEATNTTEYGENCRSVWKSFRKTHVLNGLWAPGFPIEESFLDNVKKALAISENRWDESLEDVPTGFSVDKMYQQQTKNGEVIWLKSVSSDQKVEQAKEFYNAAVTAFQNIVIAHEPSKIYLIPQSRPTEWAMNVYISDAHIGTDIKDSLFGVSYSKEIYISRIREVVSKIEDMFNRYGTFHTINIILCGDSVDGYNNQTNRGGHRLIQNLDSKGQFDVFVESFIDMFHTLVSEGFSQKIRFVSATNSNHGGHFEYACSRAVEVYLNAKYPDVETIVSNDFIFHVKTGKRVHVILHGKDQEHMMKQVPWILSKDNESWLENYIQYHGLNKHVPFSQELQYITVVVGDLHQSKTEFARRFTYKRVMALSPSNDYSEYNYSKGNGYSGFEIDVFNINSHETYESRHFIF